MDEVLAVAMYKDVGALTGEEDVSKSVYDPSHVTEKSDAGTLIQEKVFFQS